MMYGERATGGVLDHLKAALCVWIGLSMTLAGCHRSATHLVSSIKPAPPSAVIDPLAPISPARSPSDKIVNRAKQEVIYGVLYDAEYRQIAYPGGDVPSDKGACSDVVVRSLRAGGYDLQRLIHEDMERRYDQYPHNWEIRHPDPNIDHRRGANHIAYFKRHGKSLPTQVTCETLNSWQPGDLVYWKMGNNLDHCGIISNVRNANGVPLVIHNIGKAAQEDCLTEWKIAWHFRFPANPSPQRHKEHKGSRREKGEKEKRSLNAALLAS